MAVLLLISLLALAPIPWGFSAHASFPLSAKRCAHGETESRGRRCKDLKLQRRGAPGGKPQRNKHPELLLRLDLACAAIGAPGCLYPD